MMFERYAGNPIVVPGKAPWRRVAVFNPGVVRKPDGQYLMYERAAGSLRPFRTSIGVLESPDGVSFHPAAEAPVLSGAMLGYPDGSIEDARVVRLDRHYLMTFALQPYAFDCWPNGTGVPEYYTENYPEWAENGVEPMSTRSGIASSEDGIHFEFLGYTTPEDIDDRDNALFPETIDGRYALLRRPMSYIGPRYGTDGPGIWISFSEDLLEWSKPLLVASVEEPSWEGTKIGAAATPLKTDRGWLVLYHGVDSRDVYRLGALLLDRDDPTRVIGRTQHPIMEPTAYYEKTGLVIPNVIFPTANLLEGDRIRLYYGCCDTSIAMASCDLKDLLGSMQSR